MAKLQMPVKQGGLAVPNITLYQLPAQLRYLPEWTNNDAESVWLDLESVNASHGLSSLLFALDSKLIKDTTDNNILIRTNLQAWQAMRKLEGRSKTLSSLWVHYLETQILSQPDWIEDLGCGRRAGF
ncbi:hypothetical protein CHARACLAT_000062 [Characodon lateralis]|uniref:Uncharacterized protein n=1 Tax=Characodon lateralis TaxID=208331 RepID=A0ABU7DC92_9TELE|nr:hypothetical protein [Characodon lateralis]